MESSDSVNVFGLFIFYDFCVRLFQARKLYSCHVVSNFKGLLSFALEDKIKPRQDATASIWNRYGGCCKSKITLFIKLWHVKTQFTLTFWIKNSDCSLSLSLSLSLSHLGKTAITWTLMFPLFANTDPLSFTKWLDAPLLFNVSIWLCVFTRPRANRIFFKPEYKNYIFL